MDINMPVMDGIEATKRINLLALEKSISVCIITVSAFDRNDDRINFISAGSYFHVTKPIQIPYLLEAVRFATRVYSEKTQQ